MKTAPLPTIHGRSCAVGGVAGRGGALVGPVLLLVRDAAAHDPEMRSLRAELDDDRLRRMTHNAGRLDGHLRAGVTNTGAADVLWTWSAARAVRADGRAAEMVAGAVRALGRGRDGRRAARVKGMFDGGASVVPILAAVRRLDQGVAASQPRPSQDND